MGNFPGASANSAGQKEPANLGCNPEHLEEIAADELAPYAIGVIVSADAESRGACDRDAVEKFEAVAEVNEVRIGVRHQLAVRRYGFKNDKTAGIGDAAQGPQQNPVNPGESGSGGPDADGHGEHRDRRERRIARHHAQSITEVVDQIFNPGQRAAIAMRLPCLFRTAKANQRLAPGFCGIEPGTNACVCIQRDVALQLCAEIRFRSITPHKIAKTVSKCSQLTHDDLSFADRVYSVRKACIGSTEAARRAGK